MNIKKYYTKKTIVGLIGMILILVLFGAYWVHRLDVAHSTFENYYKFRGCTELVEKTDTYGICNTRGGQIKIVQFNGKWYLDGDLPGVW